MVVDALYAVDVRKAQLLYLSKASEKIRPQAVVVAVVTPFDWRTLKVTLDGAPSFNRICERTER
jgi:hypothetical protein